MRITYQVLYRTGRENKVADAFSRRWEEAEFSNIVTITPTQIEEDQNSYEGNPENQLQIQQLQGPNPPPKFRLTYGLIRYKGRLLIGSSTDLRERLLEAIHVDPNGGKSRVQETYQRAKGLFYWKGLKKAIHTYITQYDICQKNNTEFSPSGLLQPLPIPDCNVLNLPRFVFFLFGICFDIWKQLGLLRHFQRSPSTFFSWCPLLLSYEQDVTNVSFSNHYS